MILFYLDPDPKKCAEFHADRHVSRSRTEYFNILQASMFQLGYNVDARIPKADDPLIEWAKGSIQRWNWVCDVLLCLQHEFEYRFENPEDPDTFGTVAALIEEIQGLPGLIPNEPWVDPPIPGELSGDFGVQHHRSYYRDTVGQKVRLEYTKRETPRFLGTEE